MCLRETVDRVVGARRTLEMKKAADVVIFVDCAKCFFRVSPGESQCRERYDLSIAARRGQIFLDDLFEIHGKSYRAAAFCSPTGAFCLSSFTNSRIQAG